MRKNCEATILGQQYICDRCGVTWDLDDKDRPDCRPVVNVGTAGHIDHGQTAARYLRKNGDAVRVVLLAPERDKPKAAEAVKQMKEVLKK